MLRRLLIRPAAVAMVNATCYAIYDMDYNMAYRFIDACSMAIHFDEAEWRAQRQQKQAPSKP